MAIVAELSGNMPQGADIDKHIGPAPDQVWGGEIVASQSLTIGAASVQSAPFSNKTQAIKIVAKTAAVRYRIGPAPQVAVATDPLIPTSAVIDLVVRSGWVIAGLQDTGAAELNIAELG